MGKPIPGRSRMVTLPAETTLVSVKRGLSLM